MATISWGSSDPKRIYDEWKSDVVSETLRIVIRAVLCKFDGGWITCLVRDEAKNQAVGGVSRSKHIPKNGRKGKCEGVDFDLFDRQISRRLIVDYVRENFEFVDIVDEGDHFHLEIDTPTPGMRVEIKF